jgi:predicted Rossmann fold flavoprotein
LIVIGGGAAGFFTAINAANLNAKLKILIIEKNREPLQKVKVSGGGRCNLTHNCFDAAELIKSYPRGQEYLLEPFIRFGPKNTIEWFESRGVKIEKEMDGRMFPQSNTSQTILDLFHSEIKRLNIHLKNSSRVLNFQRSGELWKIELNDNKELLTRNLMLGTGSDRTIWETLKSLDVKVLAPVPSLFTFKIEDKDLHALAGNSFANAKATYKNITTSGPALITHWGLSGPAILKLSAFAALALEKDNYQFKLKMDWLASVTENELIAELKSFQKNNPKKRVLSAPLFDLTKRFWEYICVKSNVGEFQNWSETGKKHFKLLALNLKSMPFEVIGKSTFKEEFVTAGGVELDQIDLKTFSLKEHKGLYLAGEVLNIDAITGGFNFQAAWTGAWHIAKSISESKI